jgi:glycosyltransferase involved in cell wall biosynthesis
MLSVLHCWLSPGLSGGGGGIVMLRLHESLLAAGVRSRILCQLDAPDTPEIDVVPRWSRLDMQIRRLTMRLGLNDIHRVSSRLIERHPFYHDADVVHFHGIHSGFLSYLALPALTRHKPTVFGMQDLWALTGHCAFPYDCERWRIGCGRCPYPDTPPVIQRDATYIEWRLKKWAYSRSKLTIVALSQRHAEYARQGLLGRFQIHIIPNGVDTDTFRPQDRNRCRSALDIPLDRHVMMFAAIALNEQRKGGDLLIKALRQLPESIRSNLVLLLVGGNAATVREAVDIQTIELGVVNQPEKMVTAYCASDLFVSPTRAETFSLVIAEAMSCGVPFVAFNIGGVLDLVEPGSAGYLARPEDPADFAKGILDLLSDESQRRALGKNARSIALSEYSASSVAARHIRLYEALVAESRGNA